MAAEDKEQLRIMNQFRDKRGMVYDLKCQTDRLTLRMTQRESPDDPGEWHVEAQTSAASETTIGEWGPTREDALRAVGRAWSTAAANGKLPPFDFDGVVRVLTAVRAV